LSAGLGVQQAALKSGEYCSRRPIGDAINHVHLLNSPPSLSGAIIKINSIHRFQIPERKPRRVVLAVGCVSTQRHDTAGNGLFADCQSATRNLPDPHQRVNHFVDANKMVQNKTP